MTKQMTNAVQLFRDDLELINIINDSVIDSKEIRNRRNFYKQKIHSLLKGQTVGKFVLINHNAFEHIVPSMMACWELGCAVFVHDFNPGFSHLPAFKNFYDFVDLVINYEDFVPTVFDPPRPMFNTRDYDQSLTYLEHDYVLDKEIGPDTIAVRTHSSGTTGVPKLIDFPHWLVLFYVENITKVHNYNENDRPFHWKTLHHSSLFLSYAVPMFAKTKKHFYMGQLELFGESNTGRHFFNLVLPICKKLSLTRMLVPYDWMNQIDQADPVDLEGKMNFLLIRGISKELYQWTFDNICPREIVDQFGCSEVGALFISRVNKDTLDSHEPGVFEEKVPGTEYRINDLTVDARWKDYKWYSLADIVREKDGKIYFEGRTHSVVKHGETVYLSPLEDYLREAWGTSEFHVVADLESNQLFLALFTDKIHPDLEAVNSLICQKFSDNYKFTAVKFFDITEMRSGMKPSSPLILYAFHQHLKGNRQ